MNTKPLGLRGYLLVWLSLLALVAITAASAHLQFGAWNLIVSLLVSTAKTALVMLFCMNLRRERGTTALFATTGFFWLALLIGMTLGDAVTR